MAERWWILMALTLARTAMGLQFQSVPAVAPQLSGQLGLSYAGLGTLISLYLLAGIAIAIPGGWLGQRFGAKRMVMVGLALMAGGGALMGVSDEIAMLYLGRTVAGAGAVVLNVLLTKMVADWFAGREIVTAMGILIASWPLGIALAMVALPPLAVAAGWPAAMLACALGAAACLILVAATYRPPAGDAQTKDGAKPVAMSRGETALAVLAGLAWAFYNASLILVLAFGPAYLTALGEEPVAAAATVSLVGWLIIPALAAGGWWAQRIGRADAIMVASFLTTAVLLVALASGSASVWLFVALGIVFGPAGPLIMTLPVEGVGPANRALGMGIYFTCYYVGMTVVPPLAGLARDLSGAPAAPLWVALAMIGCATAALGAFRVVQASGRAPVPVG